jgi:hypothetical protein
MQSAILATAIVTTSLCASMVTAQATPIIYNFKVTASSGALAGTEVNADNIRFIRAD